MLRSLEQERANYAWECIQAIKGDFDLEDKYKSYVRSVSTYIQTNGLGNTLAFMYSKRGKDKKNAYDQIYDNLSDWLKKPEYGCKLLPQNEDLLRYVISQPSIVYRQITSECLALLNWLRRLSEGMLEGDTND